ncbi:hypothetical protein BV22DRAFT_986080, partial [Leucogyrophana mollusca]
PSSPPIPTPSKLTSYLQYAEKHLSIDGAMIYEPTLRMKGIGPDIMMNVPDNVFLEAGFTIGDVIHLKDGSTRWWNGPDAKRKRSDTESQVAAVPEVKRVDYKRRFNDGGANRFVGPPMELGDNHDPKAVAGLDYEIWYLCEARNDWFLVPRGY